MNKRLNLLTAIVLASGLYAGTASAQYTEDFRARSVLERQYVNIKGSPYVYEEWSDGLVKMQNGNTYKMSLKYDQVAGELIFKDKEGNELTFADPVREFKLSGGAGDRIFRNGFKGAEDRDENSFFEVLYDGRTILLKDPKKNIVENRSYNSSTVVKSVLETPAYYLVTGEQLLKIKKDKKSVLSALGQSSGQLNEFLQQNKLNLRDDADLAKLIRYYDSAGFNSDR